MSATPLQISSRRTAVIFWVMTVLFVAQMGWWITYQLTHGNEELALQGQVLELNRHLAVEEWRNHTAQLADSLRLAWREIETPEGLGVPISHLQGWYEVRFESNGVQKLIAHSADKGTPVGQMHIPAAGGTVVIFLGATYCTQYFAEHFPDVILTPVMDTVHTPGNAVAVSQLSIAPEAIERVQDARRRRARMFVGEGSFFILLIIIGAIAIHRALRRSREFEQRQQNFLAAVTHELKAPLASIRLFAETLASRQLPEEKRQECLERIGQDVERLQEMIDDTLEAGVYSRRSFHPHLEARNLSETLRMYIDMYAGRAERAGLKLTAEIAPHIHAKIDENHLRRAVGALIENAIKYTQLSDAGGTVHVSLTAQRKDAIIRVTDDGVGIDPNDQKRVFERFYRAGDELTRRVRGSGLGLFLAQEIIRSHGGRISLSSDGIGKGTAVEIALPRIEGETA